MKKKLSVEINNEYNIKYGFTDEMKSYANNNHDNNTKKTTNPLRTRTETGSNSHVD